MVRRAVDGLSEYYVSMFTGNGLGAACLQGTVGVGLGAEDSVSSMGPSVSSMGPWVSSRGSRGGSSGGRSKGRSEGRGSRTGFNVVVDGTGSGRRLAVPAGRADDFLGTSLDHKDYMERIRSLQPAELPWTPPHDPPRPVMRVGTNTTRESLDDFVKNVFAERDEAEKQQEVFSMMKDLNHEMVQKPQAGDNPAAEMIESGMGA